MALDVVNEAISEAERTGQRWFDAELYRTRGEILLQCRRPETTASEAAFKRAVDVTRRQQTRAFELRAALSLAKLYQSCGSAADARAVLAPALEGFSSTPESPKLRKRKYCSPRCLHKPIMDAEGGESRGGARSRPKIAISPAMRLASASHILSFVVSIAVITSPMHRQASSNWPSSA